MNKLIFFIRRAVNDFVNPNRFFVSENFQLDNEDLKVPYGLDYKVAGMMEYYNMHKDDQGIIMMSHYIDHESEDKHYYSPVKIAHYALACYNDYIKTESLETLEDFKKHLDFLVDHAQTLCLNNKEYTSWPTPSSNPKYNLGTNYLSAIVQGLVLSALSRGWAEFKDERYLKLIENSLDLFDLEVEEGGILANSKYGIVYEEYPCVPYSHVVNGFIFSLIGLYDAHYLTKHRKAIELFDIGYDSLLSMFEDWLTPSWSKYDLLDITANKKQNLATLHYQFLHIDLLSVLNIQRPHSTIVKMISTLSKNAKNKFNLLRIYTNKFEKLILKK